MTYLELIARVGTSPMDVVKMYFKGMITEKELSNVIGRNRAGIVEEYNADSKSVAGNRVRVQVPPPAG